MQQRNEQSIQSINAFILSDRRFEFYAEVAARAVTPSSASLVSAKQDVHQAHIALINAARSDEIDAITNAAMTFNLVALNFLDAVATDDFPMWSEEEFLGHLGMVEASVDIQVRLPEIANGESQEPADSFGR